MKKSWTPQETQYLTKVWGKMPLEQILKGLDRTEDSVMRKARRSGLDVRKIEEDMVKRKWSSEEDQFIIENYKILSSTVISQHINRTASAIRKRALALGVASEVSRWSTDDMEFLKEKWGILNLYTIAKRLNRSKNSILLKAHQMSLGEQVTANGEFLTPNAISSILGINIRTLYSWIWNGRIESRKFKVGKKRKYQVTVGALCGFLEKNLDKWNSQDADIAQIKSYYASYHITSRNMITIYGELPKWLLEKIERDKKGFRELMKPWTTKEEQELLRMAEQNYAYKDICLALNRSVESVKTKLHLLYKQRSKKYCS